MKKVLILCTLLFATTFVNAQRIKKIDVIVSKYPHTFNTSEELAERINKDFETDTQKARAIYSWIAMNVKFDIDAHYDRKKKKRINYKDKVDKAQKERKQRIKIENKALTKHLALAEGYTTLYKRLCELCGLYVNTIKGTAKLRTFDIGKTPRVQSHSWNAVQIDKEWYFVDVMLGAGKVDYFNKTYQHFFSDAYFFTPAEDFFLNHFPKDKGWLLVEKTAEDFAKLPLYGSTFLENDFEILSPNEGVLDLKGQDSIQFQLKSPTLIPNFSYQFNFDKEPSNIELREEDGVYSFGVPYTRKRTGYLTLYYEKQALVSYKIGSY